jgi:hypothetical protein
LSVKGNLLANPSFDSGSFEGWSLVQTSGPYTWDIGNARVPAGREAGGVSYALKVTLLPNSPFRLRNEVYAPVNAGKDYHLGIYAKGGSANTRLRLGIRYLSTGWSFLESHYTEVILNTTTYQFIQFSSTPLPEAAYANFGIWVNNTGTTNVNVFFDDAFMYEIDYPVMNPMFVWANGWAGPQTFMSVPNYFRLYGMIVENVSTSTATRVIIRLSTDYRTIYAAISVPAAGAVTAAYYPPIYSPTLPTAALSIENLFSTGADVKVRVLYNGAPNRSVGLGTI